MYESEKIYLVNDLCVHGLFDTWYAGTYFSQNQVNFATKWGFDMSNPESAAYAAGVAAVSTGNRMDWIW